MPTAEKALKIDDLTEKLRDSKGAVLLDYRGLNVTEISGLRNDLRQQDVEFAVAKNTLLRIAAQRAEVDISPDLLNGPTAIAFGWQDEMAPAKLLTEFARRNKVVEVKGGILNGRSFTAAEVGRLAELPTREVLLATFLGTLQAPMARVLGILQAPSREVAGLALALQQKKEAEA